jgi:hypothetical protein
MHCVLQLSALFFPELQWSIPMFAQGHTNRHLGSMIEGGACRTVCRGRRVVC